MEIKENYLNKDVEDESINKGRLLMAILATIVDRLNFNRISHYFEVTSFVILGPIFGCRHVQAILLFFGITVELMTRLSLSLSIVAMTKQTSENPNIPVSTLSYIEIYRYIKKVNQSHLNIVYLFNFDSDVRLEGF